MPTETTPTIIRRYYPTLSSIINSDDIPEVLGFIKDGVQSLIDKIHYKDLQFNKSPRGDEAPAAARNASSVPRCRTNPFPAAARILSCGYTHSLKKRKPIIIFGCILKLG
jgi:hypothetical protein